MPEVISLSADGRELSRLLPGERTLLGITGAPGAGKSALAGALVAYGAVVVPMDGFHLADVELARRGLLDRKGTPETFDAEGYAALLARVRASRDQLVMAPMFERELEQPIAGAIAVPSSAQLVVTEGNYLLLDDPRWTAVRAQLDAVWHLRLDERLRVQRLIARHEQFGKSPEGARRWVDRVDQPNAVLIDAAAHRAELILDVSKWSPP